MVPVQLLNQLLLCATYTHMHTVHLVYPYYRQAERHVLPSFEISMNT